jgi:hypothetical protein
MRKEGVRMRGDVWWSTVSGIRMPETTGRYLMAKRLVEKNLFGEPVTARRPRYEAALERRDRTQNRARAGRIRWLSGVMPKNISYLLPVETALVFEEAKSCFVYGNFVATIVLAASFVEHWLTSNVQTGCHGKQAPLTLASAIRLARATDLVDPTILDRADKLRLIRNPFVHLKDFDHEHTVTQRAGRFETTPWTLLEKDAEEALITMYGIAKHTFG